MIWPIQFAESSNDLTQLYNSIEASNVKIKNFLEKNKISSDEVSLSTPDITGKSAQQYGNAKEEVRYTVQQTVTVCSKNIQLVQRVMKFLPELAYYVRKWHYNKRDLNGYQSNS